VLISWVCTLASFSTSDSSLLILSTMDRGKFFGPKIPNMIDAS